MRMVLFGILVFTQISKVCAEVVFLHVSESQSVELSCPITEQSTHLHLYHHNTHSQSTLLSLSRGEHPRVSPKHRGRVDLYGGLYSAQVNVTLLDLESDDTGLYLWEITEDNSSKHFIDDQKIFLLVESEATVLILLIICGLGIAHFVKPIDCPPNQHHRLRGPSSVYMEMSRKPQTVSENISDQISHLEEVSFPVYANPNYRQPQENYYACPRQLKMGD
ncbi:uncharacterized protein LOC129408569 isoform X2 [Boleophthalmus pectinirostris]|uniref:uncharacterized protein LOC129408569 isoform X2 n=1 Tax=Boleophthalmus pectinirostris TaxID=150288 RepID=UPI00242CBCCD|nr:uncharacterized protein LOC129408569 isoform X2 [Boleophthalmus pectinirostris]